MRPARLNLSPRCLALVLGLVLASSGIVALFPATVQAGCLYTLSTRIYYYSDPGLTQYVGQCFHDCDGVTTCSGEQTDYAQIVYAHRCPYPICN